MKARIKNVFVFSLLLCFTALGCSQRAMNSQEAIEKAKAKPNVEAQVNYLVGQANSLINSDAFDEAIKIAKHILSELDNNSDEAKSIIERAKAGLKKMAQKKADELKAEANKKIDDAKKKLGSFGQ